MKKIYVKIAISALLFILSLVFFIAVGFKGEGSFNGNKYGLVIKGWDSSYDSNGFYDYIAFNKIKLHVSDSGIGGMAFIFSILIVFLTLIDFLASIVAVLICLRNNELLTKLKIFWWLDSLVVVLILLFTILIIIGMNKIFQNNLYSGTSKKGMKIAGGSWAEFVTLVTLAAIMVGTNCLLLLKNELTK